MKFTRNTLDYLMNNTNVPTKADWLAVGNCFRRVMGVPELTDCEFEGFDLDEYERLVPGMRVKLEAMAQREMEHRLAMEKFRLEMNQSAGRTFIEFTRSLFKSSLGKIFN
jgi:hypothetical protein